MYAHAEVVLSTVTNENVVASYLNKIVTTSMITVPRRLGIRPVNKAESISADVQELIRKAEQQKSVQNDKTEDLSSSVAEDESSSAINDESKIISFDEDSECKSENINEDYDYEELVFDDNEQDNSLTDDNEVDIKSKTTDVDKSLVDKMINGISNDETNADEENELYEELDNGELDIDELLDVDSTEDALNEELSESNAEVADNILISDDSDEVEESEALEDNFEEVAELLETDSTDVIVEDEFTEDAVEESDELADPEEFPESDDLDEVTEDEFIEDGAEGSEELAEPEELLEADDSDEVAKEEIVIDGAEGSEELLESDVVDDVTEIEPLESELEDEADGLLEPDEIESLEGELEEGTDEFLELDDLNEASDLESLNDNLDEEPQELIETDAEASTENNPSETDIQALLYGCFEYTPENVESDLDGVYVALKEFRLKQKNIDCMKLLKLKYNDKLSIGEISTKLELPEETVIQTLSEIADIVKEQ